MIVDCFTHTWESSAQLGRIAQAAQPHGRTLAPLDASPASHRIASEPTDVTVVLGFVSRYLEANISNDLVAAYVAQHPEQFVGFAGVDPSEPRQAIAEIHRAREELGMSGVAVAPAAQDFHPTDSQAMQVYAEAVALGMPLLFHTGLRLMPATKLEYARPLLLDEVARELPAGRIVIAHLGYPWVEETVVLLAKHPHLFAEISGLLAQPWEAFRALLTAYHHGVMDKLLFGSGFPDASPSFCIEELYSLSHLAQGTNLPGIPRDQLRGIVERDALTLLGIHSPHMHHEKEDATDSPVSATNA